MNIPRNLFLAVLAAATTCIATAQGAPKIATVDMQELFKQYFRTHEAQKQINEEQARIQGEHQERLDRIRKLETSIGDLRKQIDDPSIADTRKQGLFRDFQAQQQEAVHLERELRETMQRRSQMLRERMVKQMRGILDQIRELVEAQARKDDYDIVFDKSGLSTTQLPVLVYSKDATDITGILLKDLNKDAPEDFVPLEANLETLVPPAVPAGE